MKLKISRIFWFSTLVTVINTIIVGILIEFFTSFQTCDSISCITRRFLDIYINYSVVFFVMSLIIGCYCLNWNREPNRKRIINILLLTTTLFIAGLVLFACNKLYWNFREGEAILTWLFIVLIEYCFVISYKYAAIIIAYFLVTYITIIGLFKSLKS